MCFFFFNTILAAIVQFTVKPLVSAHCFSIHCSAILNVFTYTHTHTHYMKNKCSVAAVASLTKNITSA